MGPVIPGPQMKMAEQKENAKESEPVYEPRYGRWIRFGDGSRTSIP